MCVCVCVEGGGGGGGEADQGAINGIKLLRASVMV